jgi:hypothetical protein
MANTKIFTALKGHLFINPYAHAFAILDGAAIPDLLGKLFVLKPEHECLFRGEIAPDMAEVAPYLIMLEHDAPFTNWIFENCWGVRCAIFGTTSAGLPILRRHFRTFLKVYDDTGESFYFRYYDPRIMRAFLPSCESDDLRIVFGPVNSYLVEDVNPEKGKQFSLSESVLLVKWL